MLIVCKALHRNGTLYLQCGLSRNIPAACPKAFGTASNTHASRDVDVVSLGKGGARVVLMLLRLDMHI
eukprot:2018865-Pyramimonas_sp.AAC.2